MIEGERKIVLIEPMAQLFIQRLADLQGLREKIKGNELPIAYFDGISIKEKGAKGWPEYTPGLARGVDHGLFDAWDTLTQLGYGVEANAIINFKKGKGG